MCSIFKRNKTVFVRLAIRIRYMKIIGRVCSSSEQIVAFRTSILFGYHFNVIILFAFSANNEFGMRFSIRCNYETNLDLY